MSHHSTWDLLVDIWTWATLLTSWPFAYWMGKSPKLSDEDKWRIFHELVEQPQLMADGKTLQRIEWKYVACEPEATPAQALPAKAPRVMMGGRELTH